MYDNSAVHVTRTIRLISHCYHCRFERTDGRRVCVRARQELCRETTPFRPNARIVELQSSPSDGLRISGVYRGGASGPWPTEKISGLKTILGFSSTAVLVHHK